MLKTRKNLSRKKLLWWFLINYTILFVSTYMIYMLIYFILYQLGHFDEAIFATLVWELLPYTLFILFGVFIINRMLEEYIKKLTDGLEILTSGEYGYQIIEKKLTPFSDVYQDFNKMSAELSQVQHLRDDFTNQFSHEFKTPIASIQGFATLLKNPNLSNDQQQLYAETIEKEAARLANLSSNVMTLTALEKQEIVANKEKFNLTDQVRQAVILAYPQAEKKNISLEFDGDNVSFYGNPDLLTHVWNNLLGNALKFTETDGHISIALTEREQFIEVAFTNDGPLIPEDKLRFLFDKFYQEDKSGQKEGLGLGLAIVKRVLDLSQSSITVESNDPVGTRFTVYLNKNS